MKTSFIKFISILMFVFCGINFSNAQMYQIGTGTSTTYYPYRTTWMDARTQMLYLQSELVAAGVSQGIIYQIGFDVTNVGLPMNGFNVRMKGTSATTLSAFETTGWTTVYSSNYTVSSTGWQMIELQTPFSWNGTDNLLIEVCFDNDTYSGASLVNSHASGFNSVWADRADLVVGGGCDLIGGTFFSDRPNIRLVSLPVLSCGNTYMGEIFTTTSWQSTLYASGTIPIWSFQAYAGHTYDFSMCSNTEDTYLRLYDSGGILVHSVDDNGPFCSGTPSSMSWLCSSSGLYYISASRYSCNNLNNSGNFEFRSYYILLGCPTGGYVENEPDCYDGYVDDFNGGCNSSPNVFSVLPDNCSQFICGKSGVYNSGATRDTDWFQFTTTATTEVYLDFFTEFDAIIGIIDGSSGCPVGSFHTFTNALVGQRDTLSTVVGPGTWWIWVGSSTFSGCPCGINYHINFWTVNNPPQPVLVDDSICYGIAYLEMPAVSGTEFYWQGTSCGNSLSMPATTPLQITTSGVYYVRAYNPATACWSQECASENVYVIDPVVFVTTSNGNEISDTICVGDSIVLDADIMSPVTSAEFRWREGAIVLRDWDPVSEYTIMSPSETTYSVDVRQQGGNGRVLVLHADEPAPAAYVYNTLLGDPRFDSIAVFDGQSALPTMDLLNEFSAIITWSNFPFVSASALGDSLAMYVDQGGNVLVVAFGLLAGGAGWGITGRFLNDGYCPILQTDNFTDAGTIPIGTVVNPTHPVMQGVTDVTAGYMNLQTILNPGANEIFSWNNGYLGLAEKNISGAGIVMAFNAWPGDWGGAHASDLMTNILAYLALSSSNCEYTDSVSIIINDIPDAAGIITGDIDVCNNTTGNIYSVSAISGAYFYNWSYSGTGATINGSGNSITVDFASGATSGTLTVEGVNNCSSGASSDITINVIDCTGIDELNLINNVFVIPNPNNGQFDVEFSSFPGVIFNINVVNSIGQVVYELKKFSSIGQNTINIDLSNLSAGNYTVRIIGNESSVSKNFVIQR